MAKRTTKKTVNSNEMNGKEFFEAIHQIEQEKGIKPGYMMEDRGGAGRLRLPGGGHRRRDH